jgi:ribosomal-protein-alanine N-acetyltransferase
VKLELDPSSSGMPDRLSIERMTPAEINEVRRIETTSFTTQWPSDAFYNELHSNRNAHYFVGKIDGRTIAYGGIWVVMEDSHVTTIAVDPDFRGRKYGEVLMVRMLDEAIERGAAWMTLEVRESNVAAQRLYRKYGFTTVATRKAYYSDNNENALVMWAGDLRGELYRNRLRAVRAALGA